MPAFAWRPVAAVAAVISTVLLLVSPLYGYHRDELYFRWLAEDPAWGYVDQPPLTPLLARAAIAVFGDSPTAIRMPALLSAVALVALAALLTRELGGGRRAQTLAAVGLGLGTFTLIAGHSLLTLSADMPLWATAILFILKALLRGEGRWWLAAGAVLGAATYNKHLIALLVVGLAAGVLAVGPRRVLRDPYLWAGAALAVLVAAPNLVYQIVNDWPQLKMAAALSENKGGEYRVLFLPMQVLLFGPVVAFVGWHGWLRLWRDERVRCLAVAYPVAAALTLLSGGRFDYTAGLIIMLFCAGCVSVADRSWAPGALVANGVLGASFALPLIPVQVLASTPVPYINEVARESVGWPEFAARVGDSVRALPPQEQARAVLLTGSYGEAGMLRKTAGLPPVYSGHNQLHLYGPPPETATVAVAVKLPRRLLDSVFQTCAVSGKVDNGVGVENEFQGLDIITCRGLKQSWRTAWPRFQHYS